MGNSGQFKKGHSGNPKRRPKKGMALADLIRGNLDAYTEGDENLTIFMERYVPMDSPLAGTEREVTI